ncbi:MAG: flagellar basal body P-ring protein FlgI [Cyanobacteria bacterium]|nr:flagellar basal body P-ring protein FlgI [Cyanobacteriota bacterium]MDA1021315.1 flagellar basal body P-ring protein FlgI [Cyanobacteriota bacterium]
MISEKTIQNNFSGLKSLTLALILLCSIALDANAIIVRIKDITKVQGLRDHYLVGYGLVSGLPSNSGDKNSLATNLAQINMLKNFGVNIKEFLVNNQINVNNIDANNPGQQILAQLKQLNGGSVGNVAAVMITAKVAPYSKEGDHFDVDISSFGTSRNLSGGILLQTLLKGADGKVYAAAQGPVISSGYEIEANGSLVREGSPNSGRIPKGGIIEYPLPTVLNTAEGITLTTDKIDFSTTKKIAQAINFSAINREATIIDGRTVRVKLNGPEDNPVSALAEIGDIKVDADNEAKVVIMERTGTIVVGQDVKLSSVALAHGNISITIKTDNQVSQPNVTTLANLSSVNNSGSDNEVDTNLANAGAGDENSGAGIKTQNFSNSEINLTETDTRYIEMAEATSLADLINELNKIGITSRDLISIMQALKASGALQAELEII